jgi:hypothetical protein
LVKKLHNEELHYVYSSPNYQVKEDEMGKEFITHGEEISIQGFGEQARRKETSKKTFA